ncbi:MAG: Indole-3-glycerol phosphate synthase [Pseudomonadota bacterium]
MNLQVINTFVELEKTAAQHWWTAEDRTAWRDDLLRRRENIEPAALKTCLGSGLTIVPIHLWDSELRQCFMQVDADPEEQDATDLFAQLDALQANQLCGLFPRPGFWMESSWSEEESALRDALTRASATRALVLRCGFITEQTDVLMAADLGFSGIQIHAAELDLFELQFLIELARDCRLSPVVSVENSKQMEIVLQTDAPHIALCCLAANGREQSIRFVQQTLPRIPANCTRMIVSGGFSQTEMQHLGNLGAGTILNLG